MRLHRLRMRAFGPFAGTEEVDLDELSASGLFLLHGATGAGKTSVLDAVCFALYGRVPGARADGLVRLRSDHATEGVAPEVVCELTVGARRLEVTRSPAWQRPKRRGTGTTTEQARTLLRERVDGEWVPLTSRNDEAAQLLTDLLGMGLEQFTKVVLLPQGDFAAFLRAGAEERRPLLQRLFGTDRFADVESWLAEERRRLGRAVEDADERLGRLLAKADQAAAGVARPEEVTDEVPDQVADPIGHVDALLAAASAALEQRRAEHATAAAACGQARARADAARRRAERAARLAAALAEQEQLVRARPAAEAAAAELAAARRAAAVEGHLAALATSCADLDTAATARVAAEERLPDPAVDSETLRQRVAALREEAARLGDLLAAETELRVLHTRVTDLDAEALTLTESLSRCETAQRAREQERTRLSEQLGPLLELAGTAGVARVETEAATAVHAAAVETERLYLALGDARAALRAATDTAQSARGTWLDLRERRLAGMAAELAGGLRDGSPCPVCGSPEHPAPATAADGTVSPEAEEAARLTADRAGEVRAAAEQDVAVLSERLAAARAAARRLDADEAAHALAQARVRLAAAEAAAQEHARGLSRLGELTELDDVARRQAAADGERLAAVGAQAAAVREQVERLTRRLELARGDDPSLAARRDRLAGEAEDAEAALAARAVERQAAHAVQRARSAAELACAATGLAGVEEASSALRPETELQRLQHAVDTHRQAVAAVAARLAEEDLVLAAAEAAEEGAVPDLPARELEEAEARAGDAARALALAERAVASLEDLRGHVAADVAACAPLRHRYALVADVARCAEGTGGGNTLRMRLSAYVLAARLEQVAEAASVRLEQMSGGRYRLAHSDATGKGVARSGLGLRVVDGWTGVDRDTTSLSGGESFMASLALALGLADVVQAEAGGAAIETLFVDEGFGSLDEETLEEVMATLDGLREGGRAVGLVSHVAELRTRIPSRLEVVKTRTGSHLRRAGAA